MTEDVWYDEMFEGTGRFYYMNFENIKKCINDNQTDELLEYIGNDIDNRRALEYAVKTNNFKLVIFLMDIAAKDEHYRLTYAEYYWLIKKAIKHKNYQMIDLLIEAGGRYDDPNNCGDADPFKNRRNYDPLGEAIQKAEKFGDYEMKNYLLSKNCQFKQKIITDEVKNKRKQHVDFYITYHKFRESVYGCHQSTAYAIDQGDLELLKYVISRCPKDLQNPEKAGALSYIHHNVPGYNHMNILNYLKTLD